MKTITATNARSFFFTLLKDTVKTNIPVRVSCKEGGVIIISEDDYESLLETAELLAQPGLKESIKKSDREIEKGELYTFDDVFKK